MVDVEPLTLSDDEERRIREALRRPRGGYTYERASQLAGVPRRTLHHWAAERYIVPDFNRRYGKMWSYRDLVFVRLFAWLRSKGVEPKSAHKRVLFFRSALEKDEPEDLPSLRSDGRAVLLGDEPYDRLTGQQAFTSVVYLIDQFYLVLPPEELRGRLWMPNLVRPSERTSISPWVMSGEPCVKQTRVPTSSLFALRRDRDLNVGQIAELYPGLNKADVIDAVSLEERLRKLRPAA